MSSFDLLHAARLAADRAAEYLRSVTRRRAPRAGRSRTSATSSPRWTGHRRRSSPPSCSEATPDGRDRRRGAESRAGARRPGVDRRPARRHDQLPAWRAGLGGLDRRGGGWRARGRHRARCAGQRTVRGGARSRCVARRQARSPSPASTRRSSRSSAPASRSRTSTGIDEYQRQFALVAGGHERHPPARCRRHRPRLAGGRALRRLLGAAPRAVGHGGRHAAGARGGRRRHRSRGQRRHAAACFRGRRQSGDARVAERHHPRVATSDTHEPRASGTRPCPLAAGWRRSRRRSRFPRAAGSPPWRAPSPQPWWRRSVASSCDHRREAHCTRSPRKSPRVLRHCARCYSRSATPTTEPMPRSWQRGAPRRGPRPQCRCTTPNCRRRACR